MVISVVSDLLERIVDTICRANRFKVTLRVVVPLVTAGIVICSIGEDGVLVQAWRGHGLTHTSFRLFELPTKRFVLQIV
jgi:hypothetical protein